MQNGTSEEVKKIVSTLNDDQVPSSDVVGKDTWFMISIRCLLSCFSSFVIAVYTASLLRYTVPGHITLDAAIVLAPCCGVF